MTLPHTIREEKLDGDRIFHGLVTYRKQFQLKLPKGGRAFLQFDGAMHEAKVLLNGQLLTVHKGGYTPFTVELTPYLQQDNILTVKLDNRENLNIPPGRPENTLDFLYYSGIYRNVTLTVADAVHISNVHHINRPGSGGIAVTTQELTGSMATVRAKMHILTGSNQPRKLKVQAWIFQSSNEIALKERLLSVTREETLELYYNLHNIRPWCPDDPVLYTLYVVIMEGGVVLDEQTLRFGIRMAECREKGFYLNGSRLPLSGTNRHQQYPYLGVAAHDNAQYRDAWLLKQMGVNIVRLSHYAQAPAFYDACDELGIIVINQIPGWQYCRRGEFCDLTEQNVRDMMRRDRNHACMLLMETCLNETTHSKSGATDAFFQKLNDICKEEGAALTFGSPYGRKKNQAVDYDIISADWDEKTKNRPSTGFPGRKSLIPEYGDFEFGGHYSSSRADFTDGEKAMLLQAWNFQWSLNQNLKNPDSMGCLTWEGIDHVRGYDAQAPVSKSGMLDIFRTPKPVYYLYQSQRGDSPCLHPAVLEYNGQSQILVYANCERIKVFHEENLLGDQRCDNGADADFIPESDEKGGDVLYWAKDGDYLKNSKKDGALARHTMSCFQDGGNCSALRFPPFTFRNLPACEALTFVGYQGRKEVIRTQLRRPKEAVKLLLCAEDCGRPLAANGTDFLFVHVYAADENDTVCCRFNQTVTLHAQDGDVVYTNTFRAASGKASFLVKARPNVKSVHLSASAEGLESAHLQLECKK